MSDLISRTALLAEFDPNDKTEFDTVGIRYYIQAAPTVDAVPVVRCGECQYMNVGICLNADSYLFGKSPNSAWYCPCGKQPIID